MSYQPSGMWAHHGIGDVDGVASRRLDRKVVRRAWGLTGQHRRRLAGFLVVVVIASTLGALPPQLIRIAVDDAIPNQDTNLLWLVFIGFITIALLTGALSLVERYLSSSIGERFIHDLRVLLFTHVQRMPIAFFTRTQTGALITRLNNDVIGAQRALTGTLGGIVNNAISATVTIIAMLILDWHVTLLSLALLPLFIIPARVVGVRLQQLSRRSMALNAEMNTVMTERFNVSGAMLVKLFGRADDERKLFGDRASQVADIGISQAMHGRALMAALGIVGSLATALVYLVGGQVAMSSADLDVGSVVALAIYVTQLFGPLAQLSNGRVDLMTALVSFERVFEVTDLPTSIEDPVVPVTLDEPRGHVRFEDVSFRYPAATETSLESLEGTRAEHDADASDWILRHIDLDAPAGTMIALVGPSGAGKTSLSSLVSRLYDVTEGRVTIDGVDVRDLALRRLSDLVGVVSQDPHLFHDSIANNLRYAKPDATDDELIAAATAAQIHDVIARLPDGYDTLVGERGYRMSGGEKQRLAIARVVLKAPVIVILDEATAHLDSENERLVQDALAVILRDRTSLVIAHRLSTILDADEILVLDGGHVIERGTHEDLLARGGLYAELAHTQLTA